MMRTACLLRFDLNFICALLLASLLAVPADAQQMEAKKGLPAPRSIAEVLRSGQAIPAWAARRGVVKQVPDAELDANVSDELGPKRLRMGVDSFSSGFEPPCFIGYIGGGGSGQPQNCNWHASNGCDENCTQPTIIASNPFNGDQHLHFEFDPGQLGGASARNWAFTDSISNPPLNGVMSLTLQLNINQLGGLNEYHIRPQASGQGAAALMIFLPTGEILAFEDLDPDDGVIDGFFTGFDWVPGEYKQVGICIDNPAGRVRYFYDGDLIWSSGAGEGGQGTGVFGATTIQNLVILYDDNQNDSTSMDVDDVLIEPDNCLQPTGACCNIDGAGGCLRETAEACELSGTGLYAGDNSNCSEGLCAGLGVCGGAGTGSCFVPGGPEVPGCAEFDCCLEVCELQPTCCTEVWDSACTNIALDECSVPCDSDETQCQAAGSFDAFNSTIGEFEVADNFSPAVSGTLNTPCWSGVYLGNPFIEDSFVIRYFTCVDGVPTTPIAEFSESGGTLFVTGKEDTGVDLAGSFDVFEYTAIHPGVAVTAGEVYFVEISNGPPGGDAWFWVAADDNESNGDGVFYQKPFGADYARHFRGCRADLSFCIDLPMAELTGLCDVPVPVPCAADLELPKQCVPEGEACGEMTNNDCASATSIAISHDPADPTRLCGQSFADQGISDNDWYIFNVQDLNEDNVAYICVTITSELPMQAGLVVDLGNNTCLEGNQVEFSLQAVSLPCDPVLAVAYPVDAPGQFLIHTSVADGCDVLEGFPCGIDNDYILELSVANSAADCEGCGLFSCPADFNVDGTVGPFDLASLLGAWGQCPESGLCCQDFNKDAAVGPFDLASLLGAWGPCASVSGACCNFDGFGNCQVMPQTTCEDSGGNFLGGGSSCADCPPAACGLGAGDCCETHAGSGCDDVECCAAVCEVEPLCCAVNWTSTCTDAAAELCQMCIPPPENDNCADALVIFDGNTDFDTTTATTDGPSHVDCQFDGQTYNDIWFDYTATCNGDLTVSTCDQAGYDTDIVVYDGCGCPVGDENLLGCNDDTTDCFLFTSEVTVPVVNNNCYKIRVGGFNAVNVGSGTVSIQCGAP